MGAGREHSTKFEILAGLIGDFVIFSTTLQCEKGNISATLYCNNNKSKLHSWKH
jgi:hypothetical protein